MSQHQKESPVEFDKGKLPDPEAFFTAEFDKMHGQGEWRKVRCSLHDDRTPSMSINLDTGGFYCRGCGAKGGDLVDYYQQKHGVGFKDAVSALGAWKPKATARPVQRQKAPDTRRYALERWLAADWSDDAVGSHPYAIKKGIHWAAGAARGRVSGRLVGKDADCIIVPVRDLTTGRVMGIQAINGDGVKQSFGSVGNHGLILGNTLDLRIPWYVCEGWASAVSMVFHHQHGNGVAAVAFGKSNMDAIAQRIAEVFAPDEVIILREVDA